MAEPKPPVDEITAALRAPFDGSEVQFKPQTVKGNRALAMPYVSARVIQDRLDTVLGVECWQDEYTLLPDGSVMCKLSCKIGDRWIAKMDVGGPSEQPDGGDRLKAAFSDALKRAAVKFGVGRYLYRQPAVWADYDPQKKQFTNPPTLPGPTRPNPAPAQPAPKPQGRRAGDDNPELQLKLLGDIPGVPDAQAMAAFMALVADHKRAGRLSENDLAPLRKAVAEWNKAHPATAGAGK